MAFSILEGVHPFMFAFNRQKHFETFVEADASSPAEISIRRALIAISGILLWPTLGDPTIAVWGLLYALGDVFYVRLLKSKSKRISTRKFAAAAAASLLLGSWVGAMSAYLAWAEGGALAFIGMCILAGQGLHCMSSHSRVGAALYTDLLVVALTTFGFALGTAIHAPGPEMSAAILIGATAVLAYFVHSVRKTVALRVALYQRSMSEAQDQKMSALGQFTSGVAHDFNNLLTVISGNIELARIVQAPREKDTLLQEAYQASGNAAQLVRQLLAYSRRSNLQPQNLELNSTIKGFAGVCSRMLPATVSLEIAEHRELVQVRADQAMLETALMNLVKNASDALDGRPGEISINVDRDPKNDQALIIVRDSGPGMPEDILDRATHPFFTTKEVGQGSGLGLSMVSGFAEQSGGVLKLSNLFPVGFEARLYFPLSSAVQPQGEFA
ncbi:MAG: ATP-binding protein [Pseudomonadota bacterium]